MTNRQAFHLAGGDPNTLDGDAADAYPARDRILQRRKAGLGVAAAAAGVGLLRALARKRN